jgi:hypothetical protein
MALLQRPLIPYKNAANWCNLPVHAGLTTDGLADIGAPLAHGANGIIGNPFRRVNVNVHSFRVRHFLLKYCPEIHSRKR